ncbi:hypothetical protein JYU34_009875 [Plutella xylostella]|uniref:Uncharacterized protein n=1 Tax=Plutella xylostella TaxID=51655 RepID=A0ABQ7QL16_PLUXY|nr:hypothetical protein JYU34_009875 [Plutella xylostella]
MAWKLLTKKTNADEMTHQSNYDVPPTRGAFVSEKRRGMSEKHRVGRAADTLQREAI